ncbi:MAG TPA: GDP-mannose 4,6-dehydratase [Gemmataceae bacterium]|nr:GDP-mannose 4,6-dehydratase [Gemmataceae bacterium]
MRTVITGGAGFIGSHLCERFLQRGDEVVCVDNLITGALENIEQLRSNDRFQFIRHDISHPLEIDGAVDNVLHFASLASPVDYLCYPIQTLKVGALGTHNTLGLAKLKNARFLLASTSEVYGDPQVHPQREDYWGHVNPIGVRGCFSSDTDVLTRDGWKPFPNVTAEDEILTRRPDGEMEYHKPVEMIRQRYVGELIGFRNSKIDLLVTPNHKMLVRERDAIGFRLVEAYQDIRWHKAEMLKSASWTGEEQSEFHLPLVANTKLPQRTVIPMDVWLEFLGYFLSEGCTYYQVRQPALVNGKEYTSRSYLVFVSQSCKKVENRTKIRLCLRELGFKCYEEAAQFRIASKQLWSYLRQFGKAREKFIPRELFQLSPRQLKILLAALLRGDGSADGKKFYSSSLALLDGVQELLLKLGAAGTIYRKSKDRVTRAVRLLTNETKDFLTPLYPRRHIEWYDGFVYCVTVPNHVIYVRRNGKALWCGNCYDESKRFAEAIVMAYHRCHDINTHICRIFNTYGPAMRLDDGRVLPNFMGQALRGEPLTVYGDGSQTRSFCYVDDLVEGIVRLLETDYHEPVNLGNPSEVTILEFAKEILALVGGKSVIDYRPLPQDDPKVRQPDISRARSLLGWEPRIERHEGLNRTLAYFQERVRRAPRSE